MITCTRPGAPRRHGLALAWHTLALVLPIAPMRSFTFLCLAALAVVPVIAASSACTAGIAPLTGDGGSILGDDASSGGDDGAVIIDSGVVKADAKPIKDAVTGTYYTACLTKLAAGRVDRALHFYSALTFAPSGSGGRITIQMTPLRVTAPATQPSAISKAQTVGNPFTVSSASVAASGIYSSAPVGTVVIPGEANTISGRPITIESAAVPGVFTGGGKFCSQFAGEVTSPTIITLVGEENTCVYFPVTDGDKPPTITLGDFSAGCPLL